MLVTIMAMGAVTHSCSKVKGLFAFIQAILLKHNDFYWTPMQCCKFWLIESAVITDISAGTNMMVMDI
jgi:hypothetical protein